MYHRLCLDQLERARLRVILVGGGPGTGKSTLATRLGNQFGCTVLSSDEIRKDLAKQLRNEHYDAKVHEGIYAPAFTDRTYTELLREASVLLRHGESAILDASWPTDETRQRARDVANSYGAVLIELDCQLPLGIAKERIMSRFANPYVVSDATPEIADHLHSDREAWDEAIDINCNQSISEVEREALAAIRAFERSEPTPQELVYGSSFWGCLTEPPATPQPGLVKEDHR